MKCQKCGHDFCWLCLTEWKLHGSSTGGYYQCNLWEKRKNEDKEFGKLLSDQENAKNEM
jgi:hypothetical protein